mmetsp:Transcript_10440/g.26263  ORF Transcript_10440/g.26263 Transcript_10440/m.26263 type:complete len:625 (+) Transcript_10440:145-2019(+)|eukprot:CAMPEP_0177651662 /NCGR_PEP_ID=MMETSP0447-20121125/12682_1 /TAXON_ID=0 /ORGANISM="Stygamoeba regulata, Strain BSH-02190019" /LENGTH=624 /DNA_ID=CAMNT_0019154787 /DNA_START=134 /DNA_END=2008 /DNA_ORIENTATION=+
MARQSSRLKPFLVLQSVVVLMLLAYIWNTQTQNHGPSTWQTVGDTARPGERAPPLATAGDGDALSPPVGDAGTAVTPNAADKGTVSGTAPASYGAGEEAQGAANAEGEDTPAAAHAPSMTEDGSRLDGVPAEDNAADAATTVPRVTADGEQAVPPAGTFHGSIGGDGASIADGLTDARGDDVPVTPVDDGRAHEGAIADVAAAPPEEAGQVDWAPAMDPTPIGKSWAPLVHEKCVQGLNPLSAPCLVERHAPSPLTRGQELIFPPFRIRLPFFPSEGHREKWEKNLETFDRARPLDGWLVYPAAPAHNLVFTNGTYRGIPAPDSWSMDACTFPRVSHTALLDTSPHPTAPHTEALLVVTPSPDSWSWQHFLDRVAVMAIQARFAFDRPEDGKLAKVLAGMQSPNPFVNEIYDIISPGGHLHYTFPSVYQGERLIFPCRCALWHPYPYQTLSREVLAHFGLLDYLPFQDRKAIIYLSRNIGDTANQGRRIINEEAVIAELTSMLEQRGQGEELRMFDRREHTLRSAAELFRSARAVVGPHGSAFFNARWSPPGTLIYEISSDIWRPAFYEQSGLLDQPFLVYMGQTLQDEDIHVDDVQALAGLFRAHLDVETRALEPTYWWEVPV